MLAAQSEQAMRDHLPSLLVWASAVVHHIGHFYRGLGRVVEAGLLHLQTWPRNFGRQTVEESSVSSRNGKCGLASRCDWPISDHGDSSHRVGASGDGACIVQKREGATNKKLIISIHIPKTGGNTFSEILRAIADEVFYLDYGSQIFSPTAVYRRGKLVQEPFESITDLELLPGRSVIHGHFRISKYLEKFPSASYITWLRDPVERIASNYFFWQRAAEKHSLMDDPLCNKVISEKMSLVEFAELKETRNAQYNYLAPVGVEYCAFIGITEEYDRSVKLFQKLFCPGIDITWQSQNQNPERPHPFYKLEAGVREKILQLNELDVKTYSEGLSRFRSLCDDLGI
jgi:hypothetical protein